MLYLIVRFNFILRLSVALLHESRDLCRNVRSPVFRFISGVLRVIHRGVRPRSRDWIHWFPAVMRSRVTTWAKALRQGFWTLERVYGEAFHPGGAGRMAGRSRSDGWLRRRR